nr:hypothetical protein CFP56_28228 [Quercus suber]
MRDLLSDSRAEITLSFSHRFALYLLKEQRGLCLLVRRGLFNYFMNQRFGLWLWFFSQLIPRLLDIERGREKQIIKKGNLVPFWYFRLTHYSHQAKLFDSKVGTNLLDIILTKMEKVFLILPKVFLM